jgi:type I restriction enzyme S subunit
MSLRDLLSDDGAIPEDWTLTTIGEACQVNPPKPPPNSLQANAPVTFVPMCAVEAESGGIAHPQQRAFAEVRDGYTAFREGDVIVAKITPCMENGKAAVGRGLTNGLGFGSSEFHVLRPTCAVLADFVYHYVRQEAFRTAAQAEMTGSVGQRRVPAACIADASLPVPPLAEQIRLLAAVQALLEQAAGARRRLARIPPIIASFRQSVLAAACSGRLTAAWREEHPCAGSVDTNEPPTDDVPEVPPAWSVSSVEDLCSAIADCPHTTPRWTHDGAICARTSSFRAGKLDLTEVRFVSEQTYQQRIERLEPSPGDVLYSREGGILGIACMIPPGTRLCLGQRMMVMRPDSASASPSFLMHVLNGPHILERVRALTGGSSSPHLNVGDIKLFPIPVPPLLEQHEIVRRVEPLFRLAETVEARVRAAMARTEQLMQSILAKAFRGELVPTEAEVARREGRGYEPAWVLLERIRAEREKEQRARSPRSGGCRASPRHKDSAPTHGTRFPPGCADDRTAVPHQRRQPQSHGTGGGSPGASGGV